MADTTARFVDRTGTAAEKIDLWRPVVIPKEDIDTEVARLAALPAPENGRRCSLVVHPCAEEPGLGLAPGIRVSINVLKPGERTAPIRHNSTQVNFCIGGAGRVVLNGKSIDFEQYDVWNMPSMATYWYVNETDRLQARLTYSNAPALEKMNVHYVDEDPEANQAPAEAEAEAEEDDPGKVNPYGTFRLDEEGAFLMPYERLINPEAVESKALHWPWKRVKGELDKLQALGKKYKGRRIYLLYNPATGRTNGTTMSFFASMCVRPANIVDRPHRHTSAAINYYFSGSGWSRVEGETIHWKAGDLMLSAPGWGIHNHASDDEPVYELTVQDSPLNIAMESMLWQEDLNKPLSVLGSQYGFETNRDKAIAKP